jgi:hypothetical protein
MEIINIIRDANSTDEIYSLLTAYIEALQHCDKGESMAPQVVALPINGKADLQARSEQLFVELDVASKRLDDNACVIIKEARAIFTAALYCIRLLDKSRVRFGAIATSTWPAVSMTDSDLPATAHVAP